MLYEEINYLTTIMISAVSFAAVISIVVSIHEFGHYIVAVACGVKVTDFSIGFGKVLFSYTNKSGTEFKFCAVPFGGYVKMAGDTNVASAEEPSKREDSKKSSKSKFKSDDDNLALQINFDEDDKLDSGLITNKAPWQKILISIAGPIMNYLLGFIIFFCIYLSSGISVTNPIVEDFIANSPAKHAGMQVGDKVTQFNGFNIQDFAQIKDIMSLSIGDAIEVSYQRGEDFYHTVINPQVVKDVHGVSRHMIGIVPPDTEIVEVGVFGAADYSARQLWSITYSSLVALKQIAFLQRSPSDLSGPLKIAKLSGSAGRKGIISLVMFMAFVSVSLGLVNILPIPLLDGGSAVLYFVEMIVRRKLPDLIYTWFYRIGAGILITLISFTIANDFISMVKSTFVMETVEVDLDQEAVEKIQIMREEERKQRREIMIAEASKNIDNIPHLQPQAITDSM